MTRMLALVSICFTLAGCELIADFNRDKIPVKDAGSHASDAGTKAKDSGTPPAGEDDGGGENDGG